MEFLLRWRKGYGVPICAVNENLFCSAYVRRYVRGTSWRGDLDGGGFGKANNISRSGNYEENLERHQKYFVRVMLFEIFGTFQTYYATVHNNDFVHCDYKL